MNKINTSQFRELTGLYEPSAIRQLPGGRLLVVEDAKQHPFSLITIGPDGVVNSKVLSAGFLSLKAISGSLMTLKDWLWINRAMPTP